MEFENLAIRYAGIQSGKELLNVSHFAQFSTTHNQFGSVTVLKILIYTMPRLKGRTTRNIKFGFKDMHGYTSVET